jgi:ABC-2 type transport system permease protein
VRPYLALAKVTARSALAFRLQYALSLLGVLFQLTAMLAVWHALLAGRTLGGFTWPKMQDYLLVAFAAGALVSNLSDFRISFKIRNGLVALDLVKPIDYQTARFAETVGTLWVEIASTALVWLGAIALGVRLSPPSACAAVLFPISMLLLVLLKFAVTYLTGLICFWTKNYLGLYWARLAVVSLLSGALVPLSLLPHWLSTTAQWLPFAGMTSTPGLILIGNAVGWTAARLVAVQLVWAVVLYYGARLAWQGAVRQLTIHGG